jgi:hypothetical protein
VSVLQKIGTFFRSAAADINQILQFPFVSQLIGLIPGPAGAVAKIVTLDLGYFAGLVSTAEIMFPAVAGQTTGSQKLNAVMPFAQQAILTWAKANLPGHNKLLVAADVFAQHVANFISAFVQILNDFGV